MCGIIGYIGKPKKVSKIVDLLSILEYRGYDSSGISELHNNTFFIKKKVGVISNLKNSLGTGWTTSNLIAHTRWATHGASKLENAHPHISHNKKWVMVHNGIIENYKELKASLKNPTVGETDTEVLVEYIAENNVSDFEGFVKIFKKVRGSYAIICQNSEKPDELFVAKKSSPLYMSTDKDNDIFLASDPICFAEFTDTYKAFNDNEFAHIKGQQIYIVDSDLKPVIKESLKLNDQFIENTKSHYDHYMLKEIYEQPDALRRQVEFYRDRKVLEKFNKEFLSQFNYVKFIGCGTTYHACMIGAKYFEQIAKIPASAEIASEFIYNQNALNYKKTLFILISQSGETADTINALKIAKENGATCVALTNVTYSTLAQKADIVLPACAGPEISVASTKAYVCQLSALYLLANALKDQNNTKCYDEIIDLSKQVLDFDKDKIEEIAKFLLDKNDVVFIGKDFDFVTAREGALKMKEITYINANACPAGELKHGYLALISKDTPLIVVASNPAINSKTMNASSEASARGAKRIVLSNEENHADFNLSLGCKNPLLMPITSIVPLQYLAYRVSVLKGNNPDKPRNLAKSVTVE